MSEPSQKPNSTVSSIPMWLLAELTYRCPQQCPYCSNPINFADNLNNELTTAEWCRVLDEARALGAAQLGLSGGEPLVRKDLEQIVSHARSIGFYTNLITSGLGLNEDRLTSLKDAGLDHVQLSIDGSDAETNNRISGCDSFSQKLATAKAIKAQGYPMVLNVVLHRENIDQVGELLDLAMSMGANYVELANTQYYGWGLVNRDALLPSEEQLRNAEKVTNQFREKHGEKMKIFFIVPDYFADRPKPCSNGWGTTFMSVTPEGMVLPCQSAQVLPNIDFPNVRDNNMAWIWRESPLFNLYRGREWMKEPCQSCDEQEKDFGGCRCQAFLLTGDAANTDPVCSKSDRHTDIVTIINQSQKVTPLVFRNTKNSKSLSKLNHDAD